MSGQPTPRPDRGQPGEVVRVWVSTGLWDERLRALYATHIDAALDAEGRHPATVSYRGRTYVQAGHQYAFGALHYVPAQDGLW